ncbi:MAG: protein translocase subunit SecF [Gemmatimonadota bacterium]
MRRLFANANYDFISSRRTAYLISGVVLIIGLAAATFWALRPNQSWVNYGVDFTGGTLVQVSVEGAGSVSDIRDVVEQAVPGAQISAFGDADEFLIRTPIGTQGDATAPAVAVTAALEAAFGSDRVTVVRTEAVSGKVGSELQGKALLAILTSLGATLIYLAFRFEWRFAVAAVIATVHDMLVALGLLAVLRVEVSLATVAAVLTIVGYSLNDTIVVFDRVRENLKTGRRQDLLSVLNRSINETLPRTVLTSGTTLTTLLALFLFGSGVVRDFSMILLVGIAVGTYSSIFVASPALFEIEQRVPHDTKPARRARPTPKPSRV